MKSLLVACVLSWMFATSAFAVDEDGCFAAGDCVSMSSKWKRDGTFVSKYTNNCSRRVVIRMCNEKNKGSAECGQSGLRPGKTTGWSTYSNATGRSSGTWVGSTIPSSDWNCTNKVRGWRDDSF